jgi:hypothetical protein
METAAQFEIFSTLMGALALTALVFRGLSSPLKGSHRLPSSAVPMA